MVTGTETEDDRRHRARRHEDRIGAGPPRRSRPQWIGGERRAPAPLIGGPSISGEDPLLAPVRGVSVEAYAHIVREAESRDVADEPGLAALAQELHGVPAADASVAFGVWVHRMGQSPVVGQHFRTHLGH